MKLKAFWTSFAALALTLGFASFSFAAISWSVTIAPPPLPVYDQPLSPDADSIWTPGYWAWNGDDYYWVPGGWTLAPEPGLLWTPGYWGWRDGVYVFNAGYWGPTIGFYGGINYGFGYSGHGYDGGRWQNGHFFYNRSVSHVDETIVKNVYSESVVNSTTIKYVSYSGGAGGVQASPTAAEKAAERERHIPPVAAQTRHAEMARNNPQLRASVNGGRPPIAATQRVAEFSGRGVVAAREAPMPSHARDIPTAKRDAPPHTGNATLDKQYRQQQELMDAKENRERQALQAQQDADHQRMAKENANDGRRQQIEQEHVRQTQELMQHHAQEQQQMKEEQKRRRSGDEKHHD